MALVADVRAIDEIAAIAVNFIRYILPISTPPNLTALVSKTAGSKV
jgi:hypothetical protein